MEKYCRVAEDNMVLADWVFGYLGLQTHTHNM